jgi:hypothetical protein
MHTKMKEYLASKQGGYLSSLYGMFGYGKKTPEEEQEELKQKEEMRLQIEKDTLEKIQQQNKQLVSQI